MAHDANTLTLISTGNVRPTDDVTASYMFMSAGQLTFQYNYSIESTGGLFDGFIVDFNGNILENINPNNTKRPRLTARQYQLATGSGTVDVSRSRWCDHRVQHHR